MPIPVYIGAVIWPGREFEDKFNPGQNKVSAAFLPEGRENKKEFYVRVNARAGSRKAERLLALRKGEGVVLAYLDRGELSYHDLVDLKGSLTEMFFAPFSPFAAGARSDVRANDLDPNDFR